LNYGNFRHFRSIRLALLAQDKFLHLRLPIANSDRALKRTSRKE